MARTRVASPFARERGEGEGCSQRVVLLGGLKPLTLVLSPWPRGEAKQTQWDPQPRTKKQLEPVFLEEGEKIEGP